MGSPFRVEPVSILDRNEDSSSTFLGFVGVSDLDRNEDSLRTFPCGHVAIGRGLRTATSLGLAALVLGVIGLDPRIDTALDVTGQVLQTAPGHVVSVCIPQLVREVGVTGYGHTIPPPPS